MMCVVEACYSGVCLPKKGAMSAPLKKVGHFYKNGGAQTVV
jgi:hypothetical protein